MSVLVTGSVFWQLRRYGTAISKEPVPAAERPKAATPVVETDADPPDETARSGIAEEPEDWKAELPVFTDETPQQRIAAVARSQLGYTEGRGEVLLSDDGTSRTGYTRYGAWYGNPYGEWNTMFTYFCMYYAEIGKDDIPYGSGCWAWYETLTERDMITPCENEKTGDIIFFDTDSDGEPDRTAIVSGTEETDEGIILSVIEGNREGSVAEVQYLHGGSDMIGMLSADAYVTAGETQHIVMISYNADSESGIHVEAQAPEGVFPEGTVMQAADVADGNAIQAAADTLGETAVICDAVAIDITFRDADGREIEPADGQSVAVQIALPAKKKLSGASFALVHVDDDGEGEIIPDAQVSSSGASFTAESFSIYLVVGGSETEVAGLTVGNVPGNSAENPYVMYVGETVQLIGRSNVQEQDHYLYCNNEYVLAPEGEWLRNYRDGTDFVTEHVFRAARTGTATVSVENHTSNGDYDNFYVRVEDPKIIVKTTYGSCVNTPEARNSFYPAGTGGDDNEFYVNTNNVIEFVYYSDQEMNGYDFATMGSGVLTKLGETKRRWTGTNWEYKQVFQVNSAGSDTVVFGNRGIGHAVDQVKITATAPQNMQVDTALDKCSVDEVNEWLDHFSVSYLTNANGYIPNSICQWKIDNWGNLETATNILDNNETNIVHIAAYMMYDDVPAEFYYDSADSITYAVSKFELTHAATPAGQDGVRIDNLVPASANEITVTQATEDGKTHFSCAISETGYYALTVLQNGRPVRTIYMYGIEPNTSFPYGPYWPNVLQHSDMEIADGGKYTFTEFHVEGNRVTTVIKEYDAAVSQVNLCRLYDADSQPIHQLEESWGNPVAGQEKDEIVQFDTDLYINNAGSSGTQYEWTSNPYYVQHGFQFFDGCKVKQVVFDVNLELKPSKIRTIVTENGVPVSDTTSNWSGATQTRQNVIYEMNQQEIIDALNKCPNHSGFDFTARSNAAILSFEAEKEFFGGTLTENMFGFEIVDMENLDEENHPKVIMSSSNDASGKIEFRNLRLEEAKPYHFRMREVIPENAGEGKIQYDRTEYILDILVTEHEGGSLYAQITSTLPEQFKFTNAVKYELPSTGGTGTLPYAGGGIILISAAFILPLIRRRKEDECDS